MSVISSTLSLRAISYSSRLTRSNGSDIDFHWTDEALSLIGVGAMGASAVRCPIACACGPFNATNWTDEALLLIGFGVT